MLRSTIAINLCAVFLVGCATSSHEGIVFASQHDLARMQVDCKNSQVVQSWIQRQLEQAELHLSGDKLRSYRATVLDLTWRMRQECENFPQPRRLLL